MKIKSKIFILLFIGIIIVGVYYGNIHKEETEKPDTAKLFSIEDELKASVNIKTGTRQADLPMTCHYSGVYYYPKEKNNVSIDDTLSASDLRHIFKNNKNTQYIKVKYKNDGTQTGIVYKSSLEEFKKIMVRHNKNTNKKLVYLRMNNAISFLKQYVVSMGFYRKDYKRPILWESTMFNNINSTKEAGNCNIYDIYKDYGLRFNTSNVKIEKIIMPDSKNRNKYYSFSILVSADVTTKKYKKHIPGVHWIPDVGETKRVKFMVSGAMLFKKDIPKIVKFNDVAIY